MRLHQGRGVRSRDGRKIRWTERAFLRAMTPLRLQNHGWPGNVRVLENVIQRALIMTPGNSVLPEHLMLNPRPLSLAVETVTQVKPTVPELDKDISPLQESEKRVDNMRDLEREHILRTLAEVGGSRKLTIERLGISERTLRYKLQQYRDEGFFKD